MPLVVAVLFSTPYACSSSNETRPALASPDISTGGRSNSGGGGGNSSLGDADTPCVIGSSQDCRVVLGVYDGQESCFVGKQYCDTGIWGPCEDPRDAG